MVLLPFSSMIAAVSDCLATQPDGPCYYEYTIMPQLKVSYVGQFGSCRFEGVLGVILMVVTSRCGDYIINKLNAYINIYKYNTLNIINIML